MTLVTGVINGLGVSGVLWYAWEARKSGQIAANTLTQLREEHKSKYDSFVAVGDSVSSQWDLEVTCLGPGPAKRIDIVAHLTWTDEVSWPGKDDGECLYGTALGLPVGGKVMVMLQGDERYPLYLSKHFGHSEVALEVRVLTVSGEPMPPASFHVPYADVLP